VRAADCYTRAVAFVVLNSLAGTLAVLRLPKVSPAPSSVTGATSRHNRSCNLARLTFPFSDSVVIEDESGRILLKGAAVRLLDLHAPSRPSLDSFVL
jgi:hypothetical protein